MRYMGSKMKREEIEKAAKKYANENAYIPSDIYAENNMIKIIVN